MLMKVVVWLESKHESLIFYNNNIKSSQKLQIELQPNMEGDQGGCVK